MATYTKDGVTVVAYTYQARSPLLRRRELELGSLRDQGYDLFHLTDANNAFMGGRDIVCIHKCEIESN